MFSRCLTSAVTWPETLHMHAQLSLSVRYSTYQSFFFVRKHISNEQYWGVGLPILRSVLKSRRSNEELPVRCLFQQTFLQISWNPQKATSSVLWHQWTSTSPVHRVSQEEWTKLRESVPYVVLYRYNPKHLYPKLNGYGDNGQRKMWASGVSTYCMPSVTPYSSTAHARQRDTTS